MTEPTLSELREIAIRGTRGRLTQTEVEWLSAGLLRLTDTTPLTAEHCRAAGMVEYDDGAAIGYQSRGVDVRVMRTIEVEFPTVGMLNLALMQEQEGSE